MYDRSRLAEVWDEKIVAVSIDILTQLKVHVSNVKILRQLLMMFASIMPCRILRSKSGDVWLHCEILLQISGIWSCRSVVTTIEAGFVRCMDTGKNR